MKSTTDSTQTVLQTVLSACHLVTCRQDSDVTWLLGEVISHDLSPWAAVNYIAWLIGRSHRQYCNCNCKSLEYPIDMGVLNLITSIEHAFGTV